MEDVTAFYEVHVELNSDVCAIEGGSLRNFVILIKVVGWAPEYSTYIDISIGYRDSKDGFFNCLIYFLYSFRLQRNIDFLNRLHI